MAQVEMSQMNQTGKVRIFKVHQTVTGQIQPFQRLKQKSLFVAGVKPIEKYWQGDSPRPGVNKFRVGRENGVKPVKLPTLANNLQSKF